MLVVNGKRYLNYIEAATYFDIPKNQTRRIFGLSVFNAESKFNRSKYINLKVLEKYLIENKYIGEGYECRKSIRKCI